jgi:hypothetical protein
MLIFSGAIMPCALTTGAKVLLFSCPILLKDKANINY